MSSFLRCIDLQEVMADWSFTKLQFKLIKIGACVVRSAKLNKSGRTGLSDALETPSSSQNTAASRFDPPRPSSPLDRRGRAARKMLVQRSDSGEPKIIPRVAWGVSGQTKPLAVAELKTC